MKISEATARKEDPSHVNYHLLTHTISKMGPCVVKKAIRESIAAWPLWCQSDRLFLTDEHKSEVEEIAALSNSAETVGRVRFVGQYIRRRVNLDGITNKDLLQTLGETASGVLEIMSHAKDLKDDDSLELVLEIIERKITNTFAPKGEN